MLQHFGTAPSTTTSLVDENHILAEIEDFLSGNSANSVQKDGVLALQRAGRHGFRSFSILAVACIAVVVALVPIGLKTGEAASKAARQAMSDATRGPAND